MHINKISKFKISIIIKMYIIFYKLRLNKSGIRKVTVSRKDLVGATLSISNILVHENFKSPVSKNAPENNDLGK